MPQQGEACPSGFAFRVPSVAVAAAHVLGQQPVGKPREAQENQHNSHRIHNQLACRAEQLPAMQHPHHAEKRHLRLVTVGNFHLYFPKSGVRRRGEIEVRTSGNYQRVAPDGDVRKTFSLVQRQGDFYPSRSVVAVQAELAGGIQRTVGCLHYAFHATVVRPLGKSFVEVRKSRGGSVRAPYPGCTIGQYMSHGILVRIAQRSPQQPAVPCFETITRRQPLPADVDVGHRFTMIQHNTAPTEHEHEEAEQQPEPFMMFPPSYPFHDLSFIVVLHPQFSFVCHKRDKARLLQTKPESTRFPAHVLVDLPIARSAGESGRRPLPRSRR